MGEADSRHMPTGWDRRWSVAGAFLVGYAALQTAILINSNFHVFLNDFWILRSTARQASLLDPASLYDGFFPYLYPLLLKAIPDAVVVPMAAWLSLAAGLTSLVLIYAAAVRALGPWWALIALWMVALQPDVFAYMTNPGADALALLFISGMIFVLVTAALRADPSRRLLGYFFVTGLLVGLAGSTRYHALVLCLVPVAFALVSSGDRLRRVGAVAGGVLVGYLPQMVVSVAAGQGLLGTSQGFNVYRQAVGVDWYTTGTLPAENYDSVLGVVLRYPGEFLTGYLGALTTLGFALVVIAFAAWVSYDAPEGRVMRAFLAGAVVYGLAVSVAFSERSMILLVPFWAFGAAVGSARAVGWIGSTEGALWSRSRMTPVLVSVVLVVGTMPWLVANSLAGLGRVSLEDSRQRYDDALSANVNPSSMDQVFTNDFNFYSMVTPGFTGRYNGGLIRIGERGIPPWPEIDTSSPDAFLCSALASGLRVVVWNPGNVTGVSAELAAVLGGDAAHPGFVAAGGEGLEFVTLDPSAASCPAA